jgi:succinate dehydrogenase/fumarate reductase-like Fe-S protein
MAVLTGRRGALIRLGAAYARHLLVRRLRPGRPASADVVGALYAADHLAPLTHRERDQLPELSRCINCGLCALIVGRAAGPRAADLAAAYLRDYSLLPVAAGEIDRLAGSAGPEREVVDTLERATAACPTGVPLAGVAAAVYRLSRP